MVDNNVVRPSGLAYDVNETTDDWAAGAAGNQTNCKQVGAVRYLRFVCLGNWGGNNAITVQEMKAWGRPASKN
jgi:hypothetical protein